MFFATAYQVREKVIRWVCVTAVCALLIGGPSFITPAYAACSTSTSTVCT